MEFLEKKFESDRYSMESGKKWGHETQAVLKYIFIQDSDLDTWYIRHIVIFFFFKIPF